MFPSEVVKTTSSDIGTLMLQALAISQPPSTHDARGPAFPQDFASDRLSRGCGGARPPAPFRAPVVLERGAFSLGSTAPRRLRLWPDEKKSGGPLQHEFARDAAAPARAGRRE